MPTPKKDETKKEFMERCMAFPDMQKYKPGQRYAVCLSFWENKGKSDDQTKGIAGGREKHN